MANQRKGRPLKVATPGTRVSLGLKVTASTKARIDEAAGLSGRTQSQEAELLIELGLAFRDYSRNAAGYHQATSEAVEALRPEVVLERVQFKRLVPKQA
jgi:hypothetical protein